MPSSDPRSVPWDAESKSSQAITTAASKKTRQETMPIHNDVKSAQRSARRSARSDREYICHSKNKKPRSPQREAQGGGAGNFVHIVLMRTKKRVRTKPRTCGIEYRKQDIMMDEGLPWVYHRPGHTETTWKMYTSNSKRRGNPQRAQKWCFG